MVEVLDRSDQSGMHAASRRRLVDRNKPFIKKAVDAAISNGNISDIGQNGIDVTIPKGDLSQPHIRHGQGGVKNRVSTGNKKYQAGDMIDRQKGGAGGGSGAGQDGGGGKDKFVFHISREEFLNQFFDDCELPNLIKQSESDAEATKLKYAGLTSSGPLNKLHFANSRKKKMARTIASGNKYNDGILELLTSQKDILDTYDVRPDKEKSSHSGWRPKKFHINDLRQEVTTLRTLFANAVSPNDQVGLIMADEGIARLEKRKGLIPAWNESTDMRYRFHAPQPVPNSKAVMFCLMDVSGSMTEEMKRNAKSFYILLHLFLERHYDKIDIVFIRHTEKAEEVNEKEFFEGQETGGTVVSSVLQEMKDVVKQRYALDEWNIYGAQASDGDNSSSDSAKTVSLLKDLLGITQGYFHIETKEQRGPMSYNTGSETSLWKTYKPLTAEFKDRFWMGRINQRKDIYPVFREFFQKRVSSDLQGRVAAFTPQ